MSAPATGLVPPPHRLRRSGETVSFRAAAVQPVDRNPGTEPALERLLEGLASAGLAARRAETGAPPGPAESPIRLHLDPAADPDGDPRQQGYRLEIARQGSTIVAAGEAGLFYGAESLLQWLALHPPPAPGAAAALSAVEIEDRPGFPNRGLLLDISRNRVPTMESLFELVDRIAALKLNQLQLYTEHTFAYRGHERVWRDASPLTPEELRALDAHCRRRFVELVPNQNSFGHLHRWLRHQPYRRLAECPEGVAHPFGDEIEPFSLCPIDPGAIDLLADLYDQLLPLVTSRQLNVGCDETFDLGRGRSAAACRERGSGRVYLDFLHRLHALAAGHGRRIQFWGDILAAQPELLAEVPGDAVVLEWGYEAGHPFTERAAALAAAGLEFYLCPGTSSWNSFGGRLDNALANLAEAARAGAEQGASGYLITDWGDFGHLQPPPVSWPPLIAGAAFAWNPDCAVEAGALPLARWLNGSAGQGLAAGTGELLMALGNVYRECGVRPKNASALFKLVIHAGRGLEESGLAGLTAAGLDRATGLVESVAERLTAVETAGEPAALVAGELAWVAGMLGFAARLGRARLEAGGERPLAALPRSRRRALARELDRRIEELGPLWLARSRAGGLDDSRARLERVRALLD